MRIPLLAVAVWAACAAPTAAREWPASWQVVADGRELVLDLDVGTAGEVRGTLGDVPVAGYVTGDRVVLSRGQAGRTELWIGLRGTAPDGGGFLAGTVDVGGSVSPWYAVPAAEPSASAAAAPAATVPDLSPTPSPETVPEPTSTPTPRVATAPPPPPARPEERQEQLSLAGRWSTPTGEVTIRQEGNRLEVVDHTGEVKGGRMTGETSFVVGLRVGCCRGELTGPGMIRWEDDTVWVRAE